MPALEDPQHEAFCRYVSEGKSKRDAAVAAGYSEKSASTIGGRLSKRVEVSGRISELQSKVESATIAKVAVTIDRLIDEYSKFAFLDIRKLYDAEGRPLPIHELDADLATAAAGLQPKDIYRNKRFALDSLAKHFGMFRERVDVSHRVEGPPPKIHVHFIRRKPAESE